MSAIRCPIHTLAAILWLLCSTNQLWAGDAFLQITNPTPEADDQFGYAVCGVGRDKLLIGAHHDNTGATNAGSAYLYDRTGHLLTTFTNPTPADGELFGIAVAAVGLNRVLIGSGAHDDGFYHSGAAYLFTTDGILLTTFTNPTPAAGDLFGYALAALGEDKVLVGARQDDLGASDAGAAYLFAANGALLTTFTNPAPAINDWFGVSVAAVGLDKVLIGAYGDNTGADEAGSAYLFSMNGTLLTTFTNPTPRSGALFGNALTAVGEDKVLIGAYYTAAQYGVNAGAAYLFSTGGNFLRAFTNPTPANLEFFGISVAALSSNLVLIGSARDNAAGPWTGAAYLYNINGTLLMTVTNPVPVYYDYFGWSVAALDPATILVGARYADVGASDSGAAYLCTVAPSLKIFQAPAPAVRVSWPSGWAGWVLQQNDELTSTNWTTPRELITDDGTNNSITLDSAVANRYYRLTIP